MVVGVGGFMIGTTVGHYEITEKIGGGGMGVVYKARDTQLERQVALKFLPPNLTSDEDARRRFIQEAKSASALDHPNICTIYEIGNTPDEQLFMVMGYYEGASLKEKVEGGPLPIDEALSCAMQIADGLREAHAVGIVHRDIKPANVMLTKNGRAKIVDFGIAKLLGGTGGRTQATQTGTMLGTVAYMAPEQIQGQSADQQTDVWALGAVLFELLTGRPPFDGENQWAILNAIKETDPVAPSSIRPEIPKSVDAVVLRALAKSSEKRFATAGDFHQAASIATSPHDASSAGVSASTASTNWFMNPKVALPVAAVIVGALAWTFSGGVGNTEETWAREQAIPEIQAAIETGNFSEGFALVQRAEAYLGNDQTFLQLRGQVSASVSIGSTPTGAGVFMKDYGESEDAWQRVGTTPLDDLVISAGPKQLEIRADGHAPTSLALLPGPFSRNLLSNITLVPEGDISDGMNVVSGGTSLAWITGVDPIASVQLDQYSIGRYEVTNQQFKEFVDGGGYENPEYWMEPFVSDGQTLDRDEALEMFVDETGRPGPSTWELGDYPDGQDNWPVSGVSWYEAAAYAEFTEKSLPTLVHWVRAAGAFAIGPSTILSSNFGGDGPVEVGSQNSVGMFGAHDMAGNVREWSLNSSGGQRFILGGGWSDQPYQYSYADVQDPFDRSEMNGFRLAEYPTAIDDALLEPMELLVRDYTTETPVADEVFEVYRDRFAYDAIDLDAQSESIPSTSSDWVGESVSFQAAYEDDRVSAHVHLPATAEPPYQAVIYFPGSNSTAQTSTPPPGPFNDFVLRSGRALIQPAYRGIYERNESLESTWPNESVRYTELFTSWAQDVMRTIDYLESREDIDTDNIAYMGFSWGGRGGAIIPAVEPRIKTAILLAAGLASGRARPEVDQINFVSRVTIPVLMANGRYDAIEPVEDAQRPMFELLGTPQDKKKWVVYESGHAIADVRTEWIGESLDWLDTYLEPVE